VTGSVIDTSDQVIPGATVTLVNEATGDARTAVSNGRGEFTFRAVQPGTYTVAAELAGFRKYERRNNVLNASGQLAIGALKLEIGTVSEVVTVTSQGTVVETKNSDYSGLLTSTQIQQIQTKGRDVVNLLRLLPGVHYENDIDAMGDSFGSNIPNIGGQRRNDQVIVDAPTATAVGDEPDELVNQPRCDRQVKVYEYLRRSTGTRPARTSKSSARAAVTAITAAAIGTAAATPGTRSRGKTNAPAYRSRS
jgi:hypothetical protein